MANVTQVTLAADSRQIRRGTQHLNQMQSAGMRTQSAVASLGKTLVGLAAGAAVVRGLAASLQEAAKFEKNLVGVAKTTGLAGEQLDTLANRVAKLSTEIPVSTEELLGMAQAAGQMGVTGVDNLTKFSTTVAKLGRASNLAGDEAATALARILNVTGENINSIDTLASVIVSLGNNVAATEKEIARITTEVARSTSAFGVNSAEAAAMGAAMASVGIRAEIGGSAVGRAMQAITNAVTGGGEALDGFAQTLGLNADELARVFENDRTKAFEMFLDAVGTLGLEAGNALDKVGLGGQEIAKTIVPLANNMDIFRQTMGLANAEVKNATALNREFEATLDTLDSQWITSQNIAAEYARRLGNEIMPTASTALQVFNRAAQENLNGVGDELDKNETQFIDWSDVVLDTLAFVADATTSAFTVIGGSFDALGKTIGAGGAQIAALLRGELDTAMRIGELWKDDMFAIFDDVSTFGASRYRDLLDEVRQERAYKEAIENANALFDSLEKGIPFLDGVAQGANDAAGGVDNTGGSAGDTADVLESELNPAFELVNDTLMDLIEHTRDVVEGTYEMRDAWNDEIKVLNARIKGGERGAEVQEILNKAQRDGLMITRDQVAAFVDSRNALQDQIDAAEEAAQRWTDIWQGAVNSTSDSIANMFIEETIGEKRARDQAKRIRDERLADLKDKLQQGTISEKEAREEREEIHRDFKDRVDEINQDIGDRMKTILVDSFADAVQEMISVWLKSGIMGLLSGKGFKGFSIGGLGKLVSGGGGDAASGALGLGKLAGSIGGGLKSLGAKLGLGSIEAGTGKFAFSGVGGLGNILGPAAFLSTPFVLDEIFNKPGPGAIARKNFAQGRGMPGPAGMQLTKAQGEIFAGGPFAGAAGEFARGQGVQAGRGGRGIASLGKDLEQAKKILADFEKELEGFKKTSAKVFQSSGKSASEMGQIIKDGVIDRVELASLGLENFGSKVEMGRDGVVKLGDVSSESFRQITNAVRDGELRLAALRGEVKLNQSEMRLLESAGLAVSQTLGEAGRVGAESLRELQGAANEAAGAFRGAAEAAGSIGGIDTSVGEAQRDSGLTQQLRDDAKRGGPRPGSNFVGNK